MPSIGESSVELTSVGALVQNLGPDNLYVDTVDPASTDTGFKLESGDVVAVGSGRSYYAISDGTSDVRLLGGASGVFDEIAPS